MSLETEHRRHHTEPTPHPDEPQPMRWPQHMADWTVGRAHFDLDHAEEDPTGKRVA